MLSTARNLNPFFNSIIQSSDSSDSYQEELKIMGRLGGKRALITGGATGIGLATGQEFVKEGARVAVTGTNPNTLDVARKQLRTDVLTFPSDASGVPGQKAAAEALRKAFGAWMCYGIAD
jgi:NAD(P)-dependent dehydrogenase (short-subunit alcohol dehydrogenase family)